MILASLLTGPTRAAVATVAVIDETAGGVILSAFRTAGRGLIRTGQVRYGSWHGGENGQAIAESVVVTRRGPARDTDAGAVAVPNVPSDRGPEIWEIHCHGGVVAANRIVDDLRRLGATIIPQSQWWAAAGGRWGTMGRIGESAYSNPSNRTESTSFFAEAAETLIHTTSSRTAAIALDQLRGAMARFVADSVRTLAGEDETQCVGAVRTRASEILRFANLGMHLRQPWRVVFAGPPNVGKSSLINAILGYRRSITVDQPGTTRDVIHAQTVIEGWPVRLSDTAGIRTTATCQIERAGIELAGDELAAADLVLWVRDATCLNVDTDASSKSNPPLDPAELSELGAVVVDVFNKIDRVGDRNFWEKTHHHDSVLRRPRVLTSAATGEGIEKLRDKIASILVPETPQPGHPVPLCERQVKGLLEMIEAVDRAGVELALQRLSG
jgi:tRNA modification GTPase